MTLLDLSRTNESHCLVLRLVCCGISLIAKAFPSNVFIDTYICPCFNSADIIFCWKLCKLYELKPCQNSKFKLLFIGQNVVYQRGVKTNAPNHGFLMMCKQVSVTKCKDCTARFILNITDEHILITISFRWTHIYCMNVL